MVLCGNTSDPARRDSAPNCLMLVKTTAIAYGKILPKASGFCPYTIAAVFTNVRQLGVLEYRTVNFALFFKKPH